MGNDRRPVGPKGNGVDCSVSQHRLSTASALGSAGEGEGEGDTFYAAGRVSWRRVSRTHAAHVGDPPLV